MTSDGMTVPGRRSDGMTLTVQLADAATSAILAAYGLPRPVIGNAPTLTRAVQLHGVRHIPTPVLPSGPRPPTTSPARWAAARRLDTIRRRQHRRHGTPTRLVPTGYVIPRAHIITLPRPA